MVKESSWNLQRGYAEMGHLCGCSHIENAKLAQRLHRMSENTMSKIIGIDLGTTNSAAAYMDEAGPRLVPNALGETLTPSVVGLDPDGKLLVGRTARELQV